MCVVFVKVKGEATSFLGEEGNTFEWGSYSVKRDGDEKA